MIRRKGLVAAVVTFCILAVAIVILAVDSRSIKAQNEYLQNNIDRLFSYNFSLLQDVFSKQDSIEAHVEKSAYMCTSIFYYTTFEENESLREIVVMLSDMAKDDSQYEYARKSIVEDMQLRDDMGRLMFDFHDVDSAEKVLSGIRAYT